MWDQDYAGPDLPGYDFVGFDERDTLDASAHSAALAILRG